ncbi:hypothetical protein [Burkholderia puraquae]|uniref:hypothetical protein n=1 Tax=Burkholderia puraquae TaxID=1904757 RepID=UPI001054D283|nr:hypothetical protein [Burkholderia puraquae]
MPIQVSHFETAGKVIDANVRVAPESATRRHAKPMALRAVALADQQTIRAKRPPQIRVADRDALPRFESCRPARQHRAPACPTD